MTIGKYRMLMCYTEDDSDIIFAEFPEMLKIDLTIAKEIVANRKDFATKDKHYVIIDVSNVREITPEAREFLHSVNVGSTQIFGTAIVATTQVSQAIANIFITTKNGYISKCFKNKEDAITWAAQLKTRHAA